MELQEEFGRVNPSRMLSFVPNIDNYLLTCGYNEAVTEGKIKDIPYMLGSTADDIGVFPEMKEKGSTYSVHPVPFLASRRADYCPLQRRQF